MLFPKDRDALKALQDIRRQLAENHTDIQRLWGLKSGLVQQAPLMPTGAPAGGNDGIIGSWVSSAHHASETSTHIPKSEVIPSSHHWGSFHSHSRHSSGFSSSHSERESSAFSGSCFSCEGCLCIHKVLYCSASPSTGSCAYPPPSFSMTGGPGTWQSACLLTGGTGIEHEIFASVKLRLICYTYSEWIESTTLFLGAWPGGTNHSGTYFAMSALFCSDNACCTAGGTGPGWEALLPTGINCSPFLASFSGTISLGGCSYTLAITVTE